MKHLIALILSLPLLAHAQSVPSWLLKAVGVEATPQQVIEDPAGTARHFWVYNAQTKAWDAIQQVTLKGHEPDAMTLAAIEITIATAPTFREGITAAQAKYGKAPATVQEAYDYARLHYAACQQLAASPPPRVTGPIDTSKCKEPSRPTIPVPPAPQWKVKANLSSTTRPAYTLVDGVRGTKEVGRATVGALCDSKRPSLASGMDLWAEFAPAFAPGVVALCSR